MSAALAEELTREAGALLQRWERRYAGRPQEERRRLLLLALEREQIVTVAYRDDVLAARIARLPLPDDLRQIMRHCLVWAWKDEELHADYVRGLLLSSRRPGPAVVILGRQLAGALSGWVTATRHHDDPADASLRTLAASVVVGVARVSGKISPALAGELRFRSFHRYCRLNVALERTAEMAYERLALIAADQAEAETFARIRDDEARHGEVFALLADALDENDLVTDGFSADVLAGKIGAVSPWFLPADRRPATGAGPRSFAAGGPVWARRGDRRSNPIDVLSQVLDDAGLGALIAPRGGTVAIRTAFMLGYHRDDRSNVVDPRVVEGVARYCRRHGATDVAVLEAPTVYERFFARRSVAEVASYFGYESPHYRLVDVSTDQVPYEYERGLAQTTISSTWSGADVRIVLPKLRTDPTEVAHLSLSTLEGMDGRPAENIHASRRISFWNATMMLLDAAPPDFAVVDAWGQIADGPFGVMGCDDPAFAYRIYAGADALAVDAAVLADLGITDARRAMIVRSACHWFGLDLAPVDCRGDPGAFGPDLRGPFGSWWSRLVARLGYPVYAYASGNGKRFVPAMDTKAFPPLGRVGPATALVRRAAQAAFGLRPPRRAPPPRS